MESISKKLFNCNVVRVYDFVDNKMVLTGYWLVGISENAPISRVEVFFN